MAVEVACAGAVVFRDGADGVRRLLLARRGHEPAVGRWSLPGGRVEPDETAEAAALRELEDETGLAGVVIGEAGATRLPAGEDRVYVIRDFVVEVDASQVPVAADDALEVGWFTVADLDDIDTTDGLVEILTDWGLL